MRNLHEDETAKAGQTNSDNKTSADNKANGSDGSKGNSDNSELIGSALKSFYQTTIDEDVPDDFKDLLDKLD